MDDRRGTDSLGNADFWAKQSDYQNTRPMLFMRASSAMRDASANGMRVAEIPFENVPGEVAELFIGDLTQRGFSVATDINTKGPMQRNMQVLRIEW